MGEGIKYADHQNTSIPDKVENWTSKGDVDVFQYRPGIFNKEVMFFNNGDVLEVSKRGEISIRPYFGAPFPEPFDLMVYPFTIRSLIARPLEKFYRKLRSERYENVNLEEFGKELDEHGGINFLQVISPPKAGQTDYIKCDDGQRYILAKNEEKVLRL